MFEPIIRILDCEFRILDCRKEFYILPAGAEKFTHNNKEFWNEIQLQESNKSKIRSLKPKIAYRQTAD